MKESIKSLVLGAVLSAMVALPSSAQEVVLKGVAAFQEGSIYAQKFEQYIKAVNEKGKGQIRIQYLGGAPKVMPLFDVGKNLKDGVIDIVTTSSAYYGNVLPEAEAMKLIEVSMAELRNSSLASRLRLVANQTVRPL
jgi:TRAP-type C4-dicarboxylate transport system substrate-binding protein